MGEPKVVRALARLSDGDESAFDELIPLVYSELHAIAQSYMRRERDDHTLQTTALINEACIRMLGLTEVRWADRSHFLRVAARAMRRVLVDHARSRNSKKRDGRLEEVPFDEIEQEIQELFGYGNLDTIALDRSLDRLGESNPRQLRVVELMFFTGLTQMQVADLLDVTTRTIERDWRYARVWLLRDLMGEVV